ncbi:hypothetical protein ACTACG_06130 [Pseudomonas syringae]|uniref:hypothetical protein n=1 Tax=Pseudomonas syringae TaxID=317 RepID=UPI000465B7D8|nr:hypothetical protein [Pseudomonas syringae]
MSAENKHDWDVALRGLKRFYDEGMTVWSRSKFFSLFSNEKVAVSDYVLMRLAELDRQGVIAFSGTEDLYIKVLNI